MNVATLLSFASSTQKQKLENKTMRENHFMETKIRQQRSYNSIPFPSVISPNPATITTVPFSPSLLTETVTTQKPFLESLLHRTGAVLFRGFGMKTAEDFNNVVEAFGYEEMPYLGGTAPRTHVVGRVFTANESPPERNIPFHHEMSLQPEFPSKVFFFCEVEPASRGETPIVLSHIVYERVQQRYPEFVEQLEEHGLIYTKVLKEDDNPSPIGRGWKSVFLTDDNSVAEQRAATQGVKLEWMEDGLVKTIRGPIPAFKYDKSRQRKIWFNSISLVDAYRGWKDEGNHPAETVTFGNGKPLPADIVNDCLKILEEECVAIPWQKGDVLLIDNWAVLHARRSSSPPRHILASLCK